jgi:hypothetical protein
LSKISKDAVAKGEVYHATKLRDPPLTNSPEPSTSPLSQSPAIYKSRVRTEPTNVTAPQWSSALWTRLEGMFDEMAECCIKVYSLEKVLKIKKDPTTQVNFLEDVVKVHLPVFVCQDSELRMPC